MTQEDLEREIEILERKRNEEIDKGRYNVADMYMHRLQILVMLLEKYFGV